SGLVNLKELSLISGKTAWMAYLDIYCLDEDTVAHFTMLHYLKELLYSLVCASLSCL
ncbi:hypothetical protein MKW98_010054, partial [Papaver atlanticum]